MRKPRKILSRGLFSSRGGQRKIVPTVGHPGKLTFFIQTDIFRKTVHPHLPPSIYPPKGGGESLSIPPSPGYHNGAYCGCFGERSFIPPYHPKNPVIKIHNLSRRGKKCVVLKLLLAPGTGRSLSRGFPPDARRFHALLKRGILQCSSLR